MTDSVQLSNSAAEGRRNLTRRQRVGLWLGGLYALAGILPLLPRTPEGEVGPPDEVLLLDAALSVVALVACGLALWTGRRLWIRILAGMLILNALTALPAFFVPDVPGPLVVVAGTSVLITIGIVVLLLSGPRRARGERA